MENQNTPPQSGSFYEPSNTGEDMVSYEPLSPGSVFAPQPQPTNQQFTQPIDPAPEIVNDGVLESEYIAEKRQQEVSSPPDQQSNSKPPWVGGSASGPGQGRRFTYAVGFAVMVFILLIGGVTIIVRKTGDTVVRDPSSDVVDQTIKLDSVVSTDSLKDVGVGTDGTSLIVNADFVTTGSVGLFSGQYLGKLKLADLQANQTYILPDDSGTFCLDSNNCNYATAADVVNSIGGAQGVISLGGGLSMQGSTLISDTGILTTLNGVSGNISIQGTTNRVQVATSGNVVTLTTPQDIATSSSPSFQTISLNVPGTQAGNVICDISNNCGYAGGANSFVQGGNSFGVDGILGTNDSNDLIFETAGTDRLTIDTTGNVGISAVSNGARLFVPYQTGDVGGLATSGINTMGTIVQVGDATNINNSLIAIDGESYSGVGVQGVSNTGQGVIGFSNGTSSFAAGVVGVNQNSGGAGVIGLGGLFGAGDGIGVAGYSGTSYGVWGQSANGTSGFFQSTCTGLFGCAGSSLLPTLVTQQYDTGTADLFQAQDYSANPLFRVGYNGHLGLGNAALAAIDDCSVFALGACSNNISIQEVITDDVVDANGATVHLILNPSVNATNTVSGMSTRLAAIGVNDLDTLQGTFSEVTHAGSGTIFVADGQKSEVINASTGDILFGTAVAADLSNYVSGTFGFGTGVAGSVANLGSGTITFANGANGVVSNVTEGTIGVATALSARVSNFGIGNITTAYGLHVEGTTNSGSGSVTNNYGIYVEDQSGAGSTDSYNIYSAGSGYNLLQGHTALGNSALPDDTTLILPATSFSTVLNIEEKMTNFSSDINTGFNMILQLDPVADVLNVAAGSDTYLQVASGNIYDFQNITGHVTVVEHAGSGDIIADAKGDDSLLVNSGSGDIAAAYAHHSVVSNIGSGDMPFAYGSLTQIFNTGTGTVDEAKAVSTQIVNSTANPMSIAIGLDVRTNTGLIDDNYGIFINDQSGAGTINSYNIYSAGVTSNNYFEGNVVVNGHSAFGQGNSVDNCQIIAACSPMASFIETSTSVSSDIQLGVFSLLTLDPVSTPATTGYVGAAGGGWALQIATGNSVNFDNPALIAGYGLFMHNGTGTVPNAYGHSGVANNMSTGTLTSATGAGGMVSNISNGTISLAIGTNSAISNDAGGTITTAKGISVSSLVNPSGTVSTNYGIIVDPQTAGTLDYGIRVDAADTQTLWVSGNADNTTASAGIAFGSSMDTNLYRGAADQLRTGDNLIVDSNLGVNNTTAPNRLNVNTLTTADPDAQLAVSSGADDKKGVIVQGVVGQTADLFQAQDDTGAVLASVSATGDLTVVNATVNGQLTINGHIKTANSSGSTTIAAGAAACTTPAISVSGNDTTGTITVTTGTGCAATGVLGTITFANGFGAAPRVVISPTNASGTTVQYFIGATNTSSFTIDTNTTPVDSTSYTYNYFVVE